jgi:hypothetical protein
MVVATFPTICAHCYQNGGAMADLIPEDVIAFTRGVFADANLRATTALARQPAAHEEMLDFQVFAALDEVGPCILGSGIAVEIDTHWLGGRRHYGGRWEIADIGIVIVLRRAGRMLWRKVGLLQSKRFYSREIPVVEMEIADYRIGIGRLVDRTEDIPTRTHARRFHFTEECVYGAMAASSSQAKNIDAYIAKHSIPVYYSLYNPPTMPFEGTTPRTIPTGHSATDNPLGCRVLTSHEVHGALANLPVGRTPRFMEMVRKANAANAVDPHEKHGWRLETFVADEVMRCREGRLFEKSDDADLYSLLYERTAPIASLIQISIDMPAKD